MGVGVSPDAEFFFHRDRMLEAIICIEKFRDDFPIPPIMLLTIPFPFFSARYQNSVL